MAGMESAGRVPHAFHVGSEKDRADRVGVSSGAEHRTTLPDGATHTFLDGDEKGIDVRLAIDVIMLAHKKEYDVALIFSRDQDLSEVADEVKLISKDQNRWIKLASAFPYSAAVKNFRGINNTMWIKILRKEYDNCIDLRDYRPKNVKNRT